MLSGRKAETVAGKNMGYEEKMESEKREAGQRKITTQKKLPLANNARCSGGVHYAREPLVCGADRGFREDQEYEVFSVE